MLFRSACRAWPTSLWAEAGSRAEGNPPGAFLEAYDANREQADEISLESSPVALALLTFMSSRTAWTGTAEALLTSLEDQVESSRRRKSWPYTARGLSGALRRVAPGLRSQDIVVKFLRETDRVRTRNISVAKNPAAAGTPRR